MEISSSSSIIPPTSDVIVLFIISITFERYNKNRQLFHILINIYQSNQSVKRINHSELDDSSAT